MGSAPTRPQVVGYLFAHPDVLLHADDIAYHTQLTTKQIQNAINNMRREGGEIGNKISVVLRGRIWQYHPNGIPETNGRPEIAPRVAAPLSYLGDRAPMNGPGSVTTDAYVSVGSTKSGSKIIRDSNGKLWTLVEL